MNPPKKLIRFDWAIKRLLRDKANPKVLEGFLTSLLGKEIKIIDFLESEGNKEYADQKSNRVDIVAKDADNNKILIEVQNETENEYFHRILFGTSRIIIDHVKMGQDYGRVPKVYSINIVFFDLGDKSDYVYHGYTDFLGLHSRKPLILRDSMQKQFRVEHPGDILPEYYILLAKDFNKWSKTPLEQWMYYLSTDTIPDDADAPGLQEAREQLDISRLSAADRQAYFRHLDNMRSLTSAIQTAYGDGEMKGEAKGRAEGKLESKLESAKIMLADGLPIATISKYTGLSSEELENLRNNL